MLKSFYLSNGLLQYCCFTFKFYQFIHLKAITFPISLLSSSSSSCFLRCCVDLDCFGLLSGPWMRVQSSDSVVYAVINRGSYLSITGCVCSCMACLAGISQNVHGPVSMPPVLIAWHDQLLACRQTNSCQESLISPILSIVVFLFIISLHLYLSPSFLNT